MPEAKTLPDNIKAFEQNPEFKKTYDNNTVDKLEMQLIEADVEFLSADNKAALVWRLLDHQGKLESNNDAETKGDVEKAIDSTETVGSGTDGDVRVDAATSGNSGGDSDTSSLNESVTSTNKGDSNENVEDEAPNTNDTQGDDTNVTGNTVEQGDGASSTQTDSASNSDSQEDSGMVDTTVLDAPSDIGNINDASADEANQPAKTGDKAAANSSVPTDKAPTKTAVSELEYVEVKNNGGFNMLEPATGTLVVAGKTTKIYIKGYVSKDQVLRNIEQYNHTRGKKLSVTN